MKKIIGLTFYLLLSQLVFAGYVFNFTSGKAGAWSNAENWAGGIVPSGSADSITIVAPDNSGDWTSLADLNNITCQYLIIKSGCRLILPELIVFQLDKKIDVDSTANLTIRGELKLSCPFLVNSKGILDIKGSVYIDEITGGCPGTFSTFKSKRLYVDGVLELVRTVVSSDELFWNKGDVKLDLDSELNLNMGINDGSIDGVYEIIAKKLVNSGNINISQSYLYRTGFSILDELINYNNIFSECFLYLKGQVFNNGVLNTNAGQVIIDTAYINNSGEIAFLEAQEYSTIVANIANNGNFAYEAAYDFEDLSLGISLVNSGDCYIQSGSIDLLTGSIINNNTITFKSTRDSIRIKVPFINKGTLTSYGPLSLGDAFINSGKLEIH